MQTYQITGLKDNQEENTMKVKPTGQVKAANFLDSIFKQVEVDTYIKNNYVITIIHAWDSEGVSASDSSVYLNKEDAYVGLGVAQNSKKSMKFDEVKGRRISLKRSKSDLKRQYKERTGKELLDNNLEQLDINK